MPPIMNMRIQVSGAWNDGPCEGLKSSLEARGDREQETPALSPSRLGLGTFLERSSGINRE